MKFVFATTEPEKVLGTIKSRTHHYPFRLIPPSVLRPYLEKLCRAGGRRGRAGGVPAGGAGRRRLGPGLAVGARPADRRAPAPYGVTYARAVALLGVTDVALIDEMCRRARRRRRRGGVRDHRPGGRGRPRPAPVRLRPAGAAARPDRAAAGARRGRRSGIIDAPADQLERMAAQAARLGPGDAVPHAPTSPTTD